jgi:hypothetical protein
MSLVTTLRLCNAPEIVCHVSSFSATCEAVPFPILHDRKFCAIAAPRVPLPMLHDVIHLFGTAEAVRLPILHDVTARCSAG